MLFRNGDLQVRKLEERDKNLLVQWLSNPAVLEFYEGRDNPFDLDKVNEKFYESEKDTVRCIVEYREDTFGYIQ
ncbi:hypothetical protein J2X07_000639 [Fictibacillus barbaricus]|uniref:Uncharacterized protein n=1 Tax=Fictibacillus barbaricus TaxID=182136 RepID=A0ABU1TWW4_9BACL|nr:hypothetical protein [Fictibacillus barbaricus]